MLVLKVKTGGTSRDQPDLQLALKSNSSIITVRKLLEK